MTRIQDISNHSHKTKKNGYFEWWYFHFVLFDGTMINCVLHETDIFGLSTTPYLSLTILSEGHLPRYFRRTLNDVHISQSSNYLLVSDYSFQEDDYAIRFSLSFPEVSFYGKITKLSQPIVIGDGILYKDVLKDKASYWIAQLPHATFEGELLFEGNNKSVSGLAYQDHNWGDIQVQDFVSDWIWGHFCNNNVAVIFYQILTNDKTLVDRTAVIARQKVLTSEKIVSSYLNLLARETLPSQIDTLVGIDFIDQSKLRFAINPDRLMRKRLSEQYKHFSATYCRWSATGLYTLEDHLGNLSGIAEYIRIRRT